MRSTSAFLAQPSPKNRGSNSTCRVVQQNLSSALILEDDVAWDVRIRKQLRDFALSTNALTQPLQASPNSYPDSTYPIALDSSPEAALDIPFQHLPATLPPKFSA